MNFFKENDSDISSQIFQKEPKTISSNISGQPQGSIPISELATKELQPVPELKTISANISGQPQGSVPISELATKELQPVPELKTISTSLPELESDNLRKTR